MKCPYCNNELNVIETAIENLRAFARVNGYSRTVDGMTKCCGKVLKISATAYIKYNIHPYSEENMPEEDDFENEIGKPLKRT